jgi:5-methyltetrahydropteroyltriglutamate--homocysteine methyltransferase
VDPVARHAHVPDVSFDGGTLDCGSGLLLQIRSHMDPLLRGQLLEIRSEESSVEEDLPAWCRLTGNELVSWVRAGTSRSFLVAKGRLAERRPGKPARTARSLAGVSVVPVVPPASLPEPGPAPSIAPLSVLPIGSWPRPRWMLQAIHDHMEGRLPEAEFQSTADDAVRLAVSAQLRAGVDVVTDGEQRRDSYASFVAGRLDNCQLIPLTDLLPLVDDPEEFERELRALDVPASLVRHPAVFGPLGRTRPLAGHEAAFVRTLTPLPVKVALPGPYLLTRTMWMECISDRAYADRERLAADIVRVLREELSFLLAAGVALVQLDEPVLTEVVFGGSGGGGQRSFMCGALGARKDTASELAFAADLLDRVVRGFPRARLALHVCRGNWTRDESAALRGDYRPLLPLLGSVGVGTLLLELSTPRAGDLDVLRALPGSVRVGVGCVNQKLEAVEPVATIVERGERAVRAVGAERVLLNPDCGFATFADNPVSSADVAERKLGAIVEAARILRG